MGARSYTYDDNGNVLSDGERTLTWTAQNMVRSLQRDGQAWSLLYDADGTRVVREEAASNSATYNINSTYELRFDGAELSEARISVLGATGRVVAEVFAERTALGDNGLWENRKKFVHDDHLGSAHMITDRDGTVEARVIYGPWGQARDGNNWYLPATETELEDLPIGFTGHQPELDAGLVNMRGRMYDPVIGRFLSVDPVIENALEVGTWNAYSYVLNRPLSLVDPTGLAAADQDDVTRHDSFLAEQGFVGAEYHNVEAYQAKIEFWKPTRWQTHGPRVEDEVGQTKGGKPVQTVTVHIVTAGSPAGAPESGVHPDPTETSVPLPNVPKPGTIVSGGHKVVVVIENVPNGEASIRFVTAHGTILPGGTIEISLEWELIVEKDSALSFSDERHMLRPTLQEHEKLHTRVRQMVIAQERAKLNTSNIRTQSNLEGYLTKMVDNSERLSLFVGNKFDVRTNHGKNVRSIFWNERKLSREIQKARNLSAESFNRKYEKWRKRSGN